MNNIYEYLLKENEKLIEECIYILKTFDLSDSNKVKIRKLNQLKKINKDVTPYFYINEKGGEKFFNFKDPTEATIYKMFSEMDKKNPYFNAVIGLSFNGFNIEVKSINKEKNSPPRNFEPEQVRFLHDNIGIDSNFFYYNYISKEKKKHLIKIDHIKNITDISNANEFYTDLFNLKKIKDEVGYLNYKINENKIMLIKLFLGDSEYLKTFDFLYNIEELENDSSNLKSFLNDSGIFNIIDINKLKIDNFKS